MNIWWHSVQPCLVHLNTGRGIWLAQPIHVFSMLVRRIHAGYGAKGNDLELLSSECKRPDSMNSRHMY
jgi:hypothetical protein